jgi:hypothetical protein
MDLETELPALLPRAIAWAEAEADVVARTGQPLTDLSHALARRVGVAACDRIRVAVVDALPMPTDSDLRAAAVQTGLLGPHMAGLTLGYSIFARNGNVTWRLLSHEFRHVFQYEQVGSIAAFLPIYL